MATVTIRGSITPSAWLPRGETITVQRTPRIDSLIRGGFVDLIKTHDTPEPAAAASAPAPAPEAAAASDPDKAPAKNASRDDWAEFLADHPGGFITRGKTRDELIGLWEQYQDDLSED